VRNGEGSANQNCSLMHGDTKQLSMKTLARLDVAAKIMYCSVVCWYSSAVVYVWDASVIRYTFACPGGYSIPEWYYFYALMLSFCGSHRQCFRYCFGTSIAKVLLAFLYVGAGCRAPNEAALVKGDRNKVLCSVNVTLILTPEVQKSRTPSNRGD